MRVVILSSDPLFGEGLKCLLGGQAWCVSVDTAGTVQDLAEVQENHAVNVVVAAIGRTQNALLKGLEAAKRAHGFKVVAISDSDSLAAPLKDIADRVAVRAAGFEGLRTAIRELDKPAVKAGSMIREPLANYGMPRRLTQREREVARLVSQGLPNRRIAKVLGIQEQSVKNLVSMVMRKLHCENRVQVALHLSAQSH
jgi:DNA-binding NarL/FixJ family response regulator